MADQSARVPIIVAIIGVSGTLAATLIANWDKVFGHAPPAVAPVAAPAPVAPAPSRPPGARNLTGSWRDAADPGTLSTISHEGTTLRFTRRGKLSNGVEFESQGTGTVEGRRVSTQYMARYQTGATSSGRCEGSSTEDAAALEMHCTDSLLGSFQSKAVRQ